MHHARLGVDVPRCNCESVFAFVTPSYKSPGYSRNTTPWMVSLVDMTQGQYRLNDTRLRTITWTSLESEMQPLCRQHATSKDIQSWLLRLIGLPLYSPNDYAFIRFRMLFFEQAWMTVSTSTGVFRPCTDPRVFPHDDVPCPRMINSTLLTYSSFATWYANQAIESYTFQKDNKQRFLGFPWTGYGYTYNWNVNASIIGVSEFVVLPGTLVEMSSLSSDSVYIPPEEYCKSE